LICRGSFRKEGGGSPHGEGDMKKGKGCPPESGKEKKKLLRSKAPPVHGRGGECKKK